MPSSTSNGSVGSRRLRATACLLGLALLATAAPARQAGDVAETPRQKAAREIGIAEAASREVLELRRHSDFRQASARDAELETLLERSQRVLRAAKGGLTRAEQTRSATGFSDAASLARRATRTFEEYETRLRQIFAQIEAERAPPPPPPPAPPPPPPEPRPESVAEPSPPPPPPRSSRRPSKKLRQAADAYLTGDYDAALGLLEGNLSGRKSRAHALLLRAAARYALFLLGGETDYALRGQAADDVTACRRTAPDLAPPEDLFSPRFRDFFAATG